jgi:L-threonylcarbamoyladenylate synthase
MFWHTVTIFATAKSTACIPFTNYFHFMFLLRDDISEIVQLLKNGKIICYPTDTIWGIGCDPLYEPAVSRLNDIKGQSPENGYILLVSSIEMLKQYVPKLHPRLETLLGHHTRPLTMIYPESSGLPQWIKGKNGSVAIRVASDEFCKTLIEAFGSPIISTAAAKIGQSYPATFGGISSEILVAVDYVVKYRQDDKEPFEPSPIAKMDRYLELEFIRE